VTPDERIEAMLKAWRDAPYSEGMSFEESDRIGMLAAWAAADVEGMVQKAVIAGINHGARQKYIDIAAIDAIVASVMQGRPMADETYSNQGAECPYCGHVHDPRDGDWTLYDESTDEWECGECEKTFRVSVHVSHSWTCKSVMQGER
jgi:hypothetical protein